MTDLSILWNQLTSTYTGDDTLIDELWAEIEKAYSGKDRFYHNLSHLEYMLSLAVNYERQLVDLDTVMFSIFYHDIIYSAKRQDNEQQSAMIARNRMTRLGVPERKITHCEHQILATKAHQSNDDNDTNFLLDFDLAVLGGTPEKYKEYTENVRKEYSIYPDDIYTKGRKQVLQHFLDADFIFKTGDFIEGYENIARKNLRSELEQLD